MSDVAGLQGPQHQADHRHMVQTSQLHTPRQPLWGPAGPHAHGQSTVPEGSGFPQFGVGGSSSHAGKTEGASVGGAESTSAEHRGVLHCQD